MEVCVLHSFWEGEQNGLYRCSYVLAERECEGQTEYVTYCYSEYPLECSGKVALSSRLAASYEQAVSVLERLAGARVRPAHYEDVLADMAL